MLYHIQTKQELMETLSNNPNVILDFYADWCSPCKAIGNWLEKATDDLNTEGKNVIVAKINVDNIELKEVAAEYGVRNIPALFWMKNGEKVDNSVGLINITKFKEISEKSFE